MKKEEKESKLEEIENLYSMSEYDGVDLNGSDLLADPSDFNEEIEVTDYDGLQDEILDDSTETVERMSALYLDDNEELLDNSYIKRKVSNDAKNLADMNFLQSIAKKAIITQMKQLECGDATPRHYETLYNGMKEVRANIEQSTKTANVMEGFYKKLRDDLGLAEQIGSDLETGETETKNIMTGKDLNNQLDDLIKKRDDRG